MAEVIRQHQKKINKNRILSIIILIASLCCLIYCSSVIYDFVIVKRDNMKLSSKKENLSLEYEYYKTVLENDSYKVIIQENGYCYEADTGSAYKCR